jgi:hypothetical protein
MLALERSAIGGVAARALAMLGTMFALTATACVDFDVTSGTVSCGATGECPAGLACDPSSQLCQSIDVSGASPAGTACP